MIAHKNLCCFTIECDLDTLQLRCNIPLALLELVQTHRAEIDHQRIQTTFDPERMQSVNLQCIKLNVQSLILIQIQILTPVFQIPYTIILNCRNERIHRICHIDLIESMFIAFCPVKCLKINILDFNHCAADRLTILTACISK